MMTITASKHRNARHPCRSSTGHSAACADRQFGPRSRGHSSIGASLLDRDDLLSHRIVADQSAPPMPSNSHTRPAAPKSP
jgi:hypothetical protein